MLSLNLISSWGARLTQSIPTGRQRLIGLLRTMKTPRRLRRVRMPEIVKSESPTKIKRRKPDSAICEVCGKPESHYREYNATHWCCAWRGGYGQCRIPADFATGPVCAWHYDCRRFHY